MESDSTIHDIPESFRNKLFDNGFVIDDDCNEIDIIRNRNEKAIHSKDYMLVVLPTLNCNFKCWYCMSHLNDPSAIPVMFPLDPPTM